MNQLKYQKKNYKTDKSDRDETETILRWECDMSEIRTRQVSNIHDLLMLQMVQRMGQYKKKSV